MADRRWLWVTAAMAFAVLAGWALMRASTRFPDETHDLMRELSAAQHQESQRLLQVLFGGATSAGLQVQDLAKEREILGALARSAAGQPELGAQVREVEDWHARHEQAVLRLAESWTALEGLGELPPALAEELSELPPEQVLRIREVQRDLALQRGTLDRDKDPREPSAAWSELELLVPGRPELSAFLDWARQVQAANAAANAALEETFAVQATNPLGESIRRLEERRQATVREARLADAGLTAAGTLLAVAVLLAALNLQQSERRLEQAVIDLTLERAKVEAGTVELERRVQERTWELAEANRNLAAGNRAKSEFLANMSHELRTPLAAVQGYAELLLDPDLSAGDRTDYAQTIRRNGDHLLRLVSDILDLSKVEAGRMTVESVQLCPARIVVEVASLMRVPALEKALEFKVSFLNPIPQTIHGDPTRLRQVLLNLVGNGVKFTQEGGVHLSVQFEAVPAPGLRFVVEDTGPGISDEFAQRMFEPFTQADTTTTRRFGGTGLGLSISRQLARLMGGDVHWERPSGQGSRFVLRIPTGPVDEVAFASDLSEALVPVPALAEAPVRRVGTPYRILLVEDGRDNQRLIATHLRKAGASVQIADNGQLAVDAVRRGELDGKSFHLVLMDMQMPVMDGYAATRRLRELGYRSPILALTAHATEADRSRCLQAGCDDFLVKPIQRAELLAAVARWLERIRELTTPVDPPRAGELESPAEPPPLPLISEFADDPEMQRIVLEFVQEIPERMESMWLARRSGDLERLRRLAHQLAGSAGGYGFPTLGDAARLLERAIVAGQDDETIRSALDELRAIGARIRAEPDPGGAEG